MRGSGRCGCAPRVCREPRGAGALHAEAVTSILIVATNSNMAEPVGAFTLKILESRLVITPAVEMPRAAGHECFKARVTE